MVKRSFLLLLLITSAACEKRPGYKEPVTVSEGGAVWEVQLNKSFHSEKGVLVELQYANRAGPGFSVKQENIAIVTEDGTTWISDGRFAHIPLLQPGETKTIQVGFSEAVVTKKALYVRPLEGLVHKSPEFLLKAGGDTPLPGNHTDPNWDVAK